MIKVARAGVVIGEYPKADIPALVRANVILPTDDYWTAGMAGWSKVSSLLNSSGQPPALPPQRIVIKSPLPANFLNIVFLAVAFAFIAAAFIPSRQTSIEAPQAAPERYTPTIEPPPQAAPKFEIIGENQSEGGKTLRYYRITGEVKNVGTISGTPALEIRLRSSSGSLISSMQTFPTATAVRLAPGETCGLDQRIYSDTLGCTIEAKFIAFREAPTGR